MGANRTRPASASSRSKCLHQRRLPRSKDSEDRVIPTEVVLSAKSFRKSCIGLKPPKGTWCHITGTDLVRHGDGKYYVLEDNLRCPSGVSYVLQNREIMKRTFPQVFDHSNVRPVGDYPSHLLQTLQDIARPGYGSPVVALLTP